jgi:sterol desaturase/sphingolipid hydroxylase (fatty acid hydroxylase superfamily)
MLLSFATDVFRLSVWLVLLAVIFVPLERIFALHPAKVFRKNFGADLFYYFLGGIVPALALGVPLAAIAALAHRLLPEGAQALINGSPFWMRLGAAMLIAEIGSYWGHRWSHEIPALWRFHAVHHSAEHIDWLVNTRGHPVDLVFTRLCGLMPVYALGLAGQVGSDGNIIPVIISVIGTIWAFFIHANVRWRFGLLEQVVSTPAFHHWHHTLHSPIDRNYAPLLPWVDRLFGTFHLPRREWPESYGVQKPISDTVGQQLLKPLIFRD